MSDHLSPRAPARARARNPSFDARPDRPRSSRQRRARSSRPTLVARAIVRARRAMRACGDDVKGDRRVSSPGARVRTAGKLFFEPEGSTVLGYPGGAYFSKL